MADFRELWINYALVGLAVFGIIFFIISFQVENGQVNGILSNPAINNTYSSLNSTLRDYNTIALKQKQAFDNDNPVLGVGVLIINSIITGGRLFGSLIIATFNIIVLLPLTVLSINPIITGVITAILIITIILKLWSIYKVGQ